VCYKLRSSAAAAVQARSISDTISQSTRNEYSGDAKISANQTRHVAADLFSKHEYRNVIGRFRAIGEKNVCNIQSGSGLLTKIFNNLLLFFE